MKKDLFAQRLARPFILLLLVAGIGVMFLEFLRDDSPPHQLTKADKPKGDARIQKPPRSTEGNLPEATTPPASSAGIPDGSLKHRREKTEMSSAKAPPIKRVLSEEWVDGDETKAARRRIRVVEAAFKFPFLRLEEEVRSDFDTLEPQVRLLKAAVADHLMVGLQQSEDWDQSAFRKAAIKHGLVAKSIEPGAFATIHIPDFQKPMALSESHERIGALPRGSNVKADPDLTWA